MTVGSRSGPAPAGTFDVEALSPLTFLDRAASVFADREAIVDGDKRWTYAQYRDRCLRLAGALVELGAGAGRNVAVLAPNSHLLLEAHYGVPASGAALVALNTRLSAAELAHIVSHSDSRVLLYDSELRSLAVAVGQLCVDSDLQLIEGGTDFEARLDEATPTWVPVKDERSLLALNYTSGTTGGPKGVMYHHRGAYLQSLAMATHMNLSSSSRYLWTLPMFHCNGWCFTWAVAAAGGTHICIRQPNPGAVWDSIAAEGITHMCAAPTVLTSLINDPSAPTTNGRTVTVAVGGSPPTPTMLAQSADLGLQVTHLYGLTESFGPAAICDWRSEWSQLDAIEQATRRARQGVPTVLGGSLAVVGEDGAETPWDATTTGEVLLRGNTMMLGYYKDQPATAAATTDGWFRTGDIGVRHPDGYLEIKDRKKDLIISGGENISSAEVEAALATYSAVLESAVVGVPHDKWGERPVAFVTLRPGSAATEEEVREFVATKLAKFKVPDRIFFGSLPKTSTGKVQKFVLRSAAAADKDNVQGPGQTSRTRDERKSSPTSGP